MIIIDDVIVWFFFFILFKLKISINSCIYMNYWPFHLYYGDVDYIDQLNITPWQKKICIKKIIFFFLGWTSSLSSWWSSSVILVSQSVSRSVGCWVMVFCWWSVFLYVCEYCFQSSSIVINIWFFFWYGLWFVFLVHRIYLYLSLIFWTLSTFELFNIIFNLCRYRWFVLVYFFSTNQFSFFLYI